MAIIPRSQGRVTSQPTLQQHTPMTGLSSIGKVVDGVLDERKRKQEEAEVSAKRVELYHNDLAKQEAKVKLDDVMTREMSEQITLLKNDVSNGAMNADQANKTFNEWSKARFKQMQNELPWDSMHELENYWTENATRNATGFLPLQLRADAQKGVVVADRATEIATRMGREEGLEYLKEKLEVLNLPEPEKQQRINTYHTSRDVLDIDGRITSAIESKDTTDLQSLVKELDEGKFGYLDGPQAQQKKAQILSRIDAINKQVEIEENKRVQLAGKVVNDFKTQVLTARALDDDYLETVRSAVAGTEHEAEYNFYKSQSHNFQSFSHLSTPEMERRINQQKAKMANSKTSDAVTEEKILGVYETILNNKKQTVKDNPNQAVREAGLQTHSLNGGELKSNPKSFAAKAIENGVSQFALKDPNVVVKPIAAEDLPEAKKAFESKSVNDKLNFIGELINQSKGVPNGSAIWGATIGQLGGGDLSYVMAGVARANRYQSEKGEDVAAAIVSGTQALKNKALVMPTEELLKTEFNKYVGNSVSGITADMNYAAFKSIYAHLSERNGYLHKDGQDISKELAKTALSMTTGGVYEQGVKYGNQETWKVSKPYGMKDDDFEQGIRKGYAAISQATGISVAELEDLRLRRSAKKSKKGEIQYDLINERGTPLRVGGTEWRINMQGAYK
ncbi:MULTISPECIES: methyl-coenzyme M reductase [unclassified Acinetobacter]|uniref:methyl-coenzyme M reductase n=1 Tax=unclassified Acinetobacter TaxID=196816 RepID=UPI0015D23F25|nr:MULTISPECIES: methyl-coenzyme M reductase [unclassified Acinetobacter]